MEPTPEQLQIIEGEKLAVLATVRRDGTPQLTPVNYAYADGAVLISTTRERAKYANLRRDERVSLCIMRPEGRPYTTIYGRARIEEEDVAAGTTLVFQRISDRQLPDNFGEVLRQQNRILIVVTPERIVP